ncbi:PREDICTED: uncharacterized protein LOC104772938 [Camelina sativa]|uniref:Uncharacterized protein LOC104772938 n=1 Tax=Camelina sativa TaxID=90675 RepID=A0ABM0Y5C9_CAMSA|nr:PREDICTED: uncharacterized protein LOC104772938 [Camelina sativa]
MLSGALAVSERLASRGLLIDTRCMVCGHTEETICHMLFKCHVARQVYAVSNVPSPPNGFSDHDVVKNWEFLMGLMQEERQPEEIRRTIPWLLWGTWKWRNNFIFQSKQMDIQELVNKAYQESSQWVAAQVVVASLDKYLVVKQPSIEMKWRRPMVGVVKCNIAASWRNKLTMVGGAWITRDCQGHVLHHARSALQATDTGILANLRCSLWALEALQILHVTRVEVVMDNAAVVDAINSPCEWPRYAFILRDIHLILASFDYSECHQVAISANQVAVVIAKSVTSYLSLGGPSWLHEQVRADMGF